jgi:aconitate hydratase
MMRGTFANVRVRNQLVEREGGWTRYLPDGEEMTVFDASERYRAEGTPLIIIAGKEYGTGSSRDWAGKGPALLGVKAAIAESYERIHRSNLVGMGIVPLEFAPGENLESHGLTGRERFDILGIDDSLRPKQTLSVLAIADDGTETRFEVMCRIDTPVEVDYYRHGGILQYVLRQLLD